MTDIKNTPQELTIEQRRQILHSSIAAYTRKGYRIVAQNDASAQLIKSKSFSCLWATIWFLLFGIGILIYLFYYWAKKDEFVYIYVDLFGHISTSDRGRQTHLKTTPPVFKPHAEDAGITQPTSIQTKPKTREPVTWPILLIALLMLCGGAVFLFTMYDTVATIYNADSMQTISPTKTPKPTNTSTTTNTPRPTSTPWPTNTPRPDLGNPIDAFIACQEYVELKLNYPLGAKWASIIDSQYGELKDEPGFYGVISYVDAQNAFGVYKRVHFQCKLEYAGNRIYLLEDINIQE